MLTISSGHYGKGTGAKDILDEGQETIYVVEQLRQKLLSSLVKSNIIIDRQSKNQRENLNYIVAQHNATTRELDVSIHFNSSGSRSTSGIGTEVLYVNPQLKPLAEKMSAAIAKASGLKNRGAKLRNNLAFLNGTNKPSILIELCFVNSVEDVRLYEQNKDKIFSAIVSELENYSVPKNNLFSHPALYQKVYALFQDREQVRMQLQQGVEMGAFQRDWLDKFDRGVLTLIDYIALTTLQFKKNNG